MTQSRRFLTKQQFDIERKASPSCNEVFIATIKEIDETKKTGLAGKQGFFKPCCLPSDKGIYADNYPPIVAKYVVAFSVFSRAALGEKASEEILAFDDFGKPTGTFSVKIPDFVPLLAKYADDYSNEHHKRLGNPDEALLIEKDFAAILVSSYRHENDDLNPGNVSVNGVVDPELNYAKLMRIFKKTPYLPGIISSLFRTNCQVKEQDLLQFPNVQDRTHWPTNFIPKNLNFKKAFKSTACSNLANNVDFNRQFFTAILKELLAYDQPMLEKRMRYYLGNIGLDLHELTPETRSELLAFGEESELFYKKADDGSSKEYTFVEHCSRLFAMKHAHFSETVLRIQEFQEFIVKNHTLYKETREWFVKQNQKIDHPELRYNLETIDQTYRDLWHNCFMATLCIQLNILNKIKEQAINLNNEDPSERFVLVSFESIAKQDEGEPKELTRMKQTISAKKRAKRKQKKLLQLKALNIESTEQRPFLKASELLQELYDKLFTLLVEHYSKDNLSSDDNRELTLHIRELLHQSKKDIERLARHSESKEKNLRYQEDLSELRTLTCYLNKFRSGLCSLLNDFQSKESISIDLSPLSDTELPSPRSSSPRLMASPQNAQPSASFFTSTPSTEKSSATPLPDTKKSSDIHSDEEDDYELIDTQASKKEIIDTLSTLLSSWLTTIPPTSINNIITKAYDQYKPAGSEPEISIFNPLYYNPIKYWRSRTKDIEALLAADKSTMSKTQLSLHDFLFKHYGRWKSTSINTLLIKEFCLKLIEHYRNPKNALECLAISHNTINQIHMRVNDKEFDWSEVVEAIALKTFNNHTRQVSKVLD